MGVRRICKKRTSKFVDVVIRTFQWTFRWTVRRTVHRTIHWTVHRTVIWTSFSVKPWQPVSRTLPVSKTGSIEHSIEVILPPNSKLCGALSAPESDFSGLRCESYFWQGKKTVLEASRALWMDLQNVDDTQKYPTP